MSKKDNGKNLFSNPLEKFAKFAKDEIKGAAQLKVTAKTTGATLKGLAKLGFFGKAVIATGGIIIIGGAIWLTVHSYQSLRNIDAGPPAPAVVNQSPSANQTVTPSANPVVAPSEAPSEPEPAGNELSGKFIHHEDKNMTITFSDDNAITVGMYGYDVVGTYETDNGFMTFDFPGESVGYGLLANGGAYSLDGGVFTFDGERYIRDAQSGPGNGPNGSGGDNDPDPKGGNEDPPTEKDEPEIIGGGVAATYVREDGAVSITFSGEKITVVIGNRIEPGTYEAKNGYMIISFNNQVGWGVFANSGAYSFEEDGDILFYNHEKYIKE